MNRDEWGRTWLDRVGDWCFEMACAIIIFICIPCLMIWAALKVFNLA